MRSTLAAAKKYLITLFGFRNSFHLSLLGHRLRVHYNLRNMKAERDYSIILQLARDKKCFFDVGANQGIISLLVADQNTATQIHAFEASEDAVNVIKFNLALNNFQDRVTVINSLIADRSGYVIPFYWDGSSGGSSITQGRLGHANAMYKSTFSLDDYVDQFQLKPDFIKMDIEGAEGIAVRGMARILKSIRPVLFVELHELGSRKMFENAGDILQYIGQHDYHMLYLRTGERITSMDVLKDRGRCHVLLLPSESNDGSFLKSFNLDGL